MPTETLLKIGSGIIVVAASVTVGASLGAYIAKKYPRPAGHDTEDEKEHGFTHTADGNQQQPLLDENQVRKVVIDVPEIDEKAQVEEKQPCKSVCLQMIKF